jgi:hypothetical protein
VGVSALSIPRARSLVAVAAVVVVGVVLVALTLQRPALPTYAPTPPAPRDAGSRLVGPLLYTVDATSQEQWRYFSFRLGSVVENPGALDWDLAFRRYQIIANGGGQFVGKGGVADLGAVAFDTVGTVPEEGYQATDGGASPRNPAIASWYDYGFFSHILTPKARVFAVRTADGRYAKVEIVGYYCAGAEPGCLTFRYVYQGDGSRSTPSAGAAAAR